MVTERENFVKANWALSDMECGDLSPLQVDFTDVISL
jgi:hypothetical protein